MTRLAIAASLFLLLSPAFAFAGDVVRVPSSGSDPAAAVEPASGGEAGAFVVRGGDGARIVAFERTSITGTLGSRLAVCEGDPSRGAPPRVRLLRGGFHVHVGSRDVEVDLAGAILRARSARLVAAELEGVWLVRVEDLLDGGSAVLVEERPPAADAGALDADAGAPPEAREEIEHPLPPGRPLAVRVGEPLAEAGRREVRFLDRTSARVALQRTDLIAPLLSPIPLEDPRDFAVSKAEAEAAMSEIELEEIEVELGSVEICID